MLPHFLVIGAQKAGSTYVLECLRAHPEIYMPRAEVPFFEGELYHADRLDQFERHFDAACAGQIIGVKRPNWLGSPECPSRIAKHLPEVKLIAILRNPVERAVSAYFHYMASGFIPIRPIEVGMPDLLDGKYDHLPRAREIIEFGFYRKHLMNYERYFATERIHVALLDDFRPEPKPALEAMFRFLGVDPSFLPAGTDRRPMAAPYSITRLRLRTACHGLIFKHSRDSAYLEPRRNPLSRAVNLANTAIDRNVWARLFNAQAPRLSEELAVRLDAKYATDVNGLRLRLGRPISHWPTGLTQAVREPLH